MIRIRGLSMLLILLFGCDSFAARPVGSLRKSNKIRSEYNKLAREKQREADRLRMQARYVTRDPYIPQKLDYGVELGALWRKQNNYWLGTDIGYHIGTCVFSQSQTCQNYVDLILGIGGRKSYTHFLGLTSLRWQFVNFPSSWSPLARILVGLDHSNTPDGLETHPAYGVGAGITTYLHPRIDLRIEVRALQSSTINTQVLFSTQLKIDEWIEYFANRIKDVGIGTVSVTTKVVEGAAGATETVIQTTEETVKKVVTPNKKNKDISQ